MGTSRRFIQISPPESRGIYVSLQGPALRKTPRSRKVDKCGTVCKRCFPVRSYSRANQNSSDESKFLREVTDLFERNQLQLPEIGLVLPFAEAAHAHALLEQGQVRGRVVLEVK